MTAPFSARELIAFVVVAVLVGCSGEKPMPPGYQGIVEHDDRHLGFQLGGRLEEIHFDRGDLIEIGELIWLVGLLIVLTALSSLRFRKKLD